MSLSGPRLQLQRAGLQWPLPALLLNMLSLCLPEPLVKWAWPPPVPRSLGLTLSPLRCQKAGHVYAASSTGRLMPQSGALNLESIPEGHPRPEKNSLQLQLNLGSEFYFSPRPGPQLAIWGQES